MKLALGTVQFGLPYGIANQQGQVSRSEAELILKFAKAQGMDTLDTAMAYGNSEKTLGSIGVGDWNIVSKLPPMPDDCINVEAWVEEQVSASLQRLKVARMEGLLLHRPEQLLLHKKGHVLYQSLLDLKKKNIINKIGISIYQPAELDSLFSIYNGFDIVQAPFNVFDRSLMSSGWLEKLHGSGTEIHTRSAFLQGLLLMPKDKRPEKFGRWQSLWQQWDTWLEHNKTTALEACLLYPLSIPQISKVIVGTDSLAQLKQIVKAASKSEFPKPPDSLQIDDPLLINPALWGNL